MTKALALDLQKLKARAFDRAEWAEEAIRRYHAATSNLNVAEVQPLRALYAWMFVPTTLWPFNVQDVLENCLSTLEKGKRLNSRHQLLIDLLPEPRLLITCHSVSQDGNLWPWLARHQQIQNPPVGSATSLALC